MHRTATALWAWATLSLLASSGIAADGLVLNESDYLEMRGLNVMLAQDYYPEGHQSGVVIVQNGLRVAANGDLRLDRTPGQWQPVPRAGKLEVDRARQELRVRMEFPDEKRDRSGLNPIDYPDLRFPYTLRVRPEGRSFRIVVDLDAPLPDAWIGKVGFNLELFPGILFGKTWSCGATSGVFPTQPNGPGTLDTQDRYQIDAMTHGRRLVIAPESERQRLTIEAVNGGDLELIDGRGLHNNGWFIVRSLISPGATQGAVSWLVTPHALPGWISDPVVQVSQVGYHPAQQKWAVVELDPHDTRRPGVVVSRILDTGQREIMLSGPGKEWGRFLRYRYLRFDFTAVTRPGTYVVSFGGTESNPFRIADDVYRRGVWQPTLEYFLPVQMCHVQVVEHYRVWHGACHADDARMAPTNHVHFDGYSQGPSTLAPYAPGDHVPGLDLGGWHDAGDDDLRIESQADTMEGLALAYEAFGPDHDGTTVDEEHRLVEIHQPDGKPDILQQIEHGALTVVGGYRALGRFYRGIITPTLRQYTHLGDFSTQTDGVVFDPEASPDPPAVGSGVPGSADDRWVFTEQNPRHELAAAADLAAAARALRGYDDVLASECLAIAREIWSVGAAPPSPEQARSWPDPRIRLAVELLLTTGDRQYAEYLVKHQDEIREHFGSVGWRVGRALSTINDPTFTTAMREAARSLRAETLDLERQTPYGVPYRPDIWGAGWLIQGFGAQQYFLHEAFPDIYPIDPMLHALDFVLGCHPGSNTASFVSGVGARSTTVAYGFNRADWSFIPGGSASGTALIRPDFPELLEWPYLWQQTEYVLGHGTTDYLFLALAADHVLNRPR